MDTISIRLAEPRDMPTVIAMVAELLTELGEEGEDVDLLPFEQLSVGWLLGDGTHIAYLAETSTGQLIGILTLTESFAIYANGRYGIINEMYVLPDHRSSAVGTKLIDAAINHAKAKGWQRIEVTAPESPRWNRTRAFYEQRGFTFTGPKLKLLFGKP